MASTAFITLYSITNNDKLTQALNILAEISSVSLNSDVKKKAEEAGIIGVERITLFFDGSTQEAASSDQR